MSSTYSELDIQTVTLSRCAGSNGDDIKADFHLGLKGEVALEETFSWPGCGDKALAKQVINLWRRATALRLEKISKSRDWPAQVEMTWRGEEWNACVSWEAAENCVAVKVRVKNCESLKDAEQTARKLLLKTAEELSVFSGPILGRYPDQSGIKEDVHPAWAFLVLGLARP
ncbi:MAG TPA: hypothetical protein VGE72_00425 [Azospirillum sp.]